MARLILFRDRQKFGLDVRDGTYVLGRDESLADVVIPDHTVSSRHAEIEVIGDRCVLRDLGSSNGTFINGVRIQRAQQITPNDDVLLGAARIAIEFERPAAPVSPGSTTRLSAESPRPSAPERLPGISETSVEAPIPRQKKRLNWGLSVWLAGAGSIMVLVFFMLFVEIYSQSAMTRAQIANRFNTLSAQYMHLLHQSPLPELPQPVVDQWLTEPIFVLDRDGKVLFPAQQPGADPIVSPLIDKKTGKVFDAAKSGLYRLRIPTAAGPQIGIASNPVTYNGEILGYVVARPVSGFSNLPLIALMIFCAAVIALFILYFALRPVTADVRADLHTLQEKLSAFAHGFITELPRSARVPELSELAAEFETVIRSAEHGSPGVQKQAGRTDAQYAPMCAALFDAARLPYCFIGSDFQLLASNRELGSIGELRTVRPGVSIFDAGMTSLQSKQIVRALADARSGGDGRAVTSLTRGGEIRDCVVHVRKFAEQGRGEPIFGLVFEIGGESQT